MRNESGAAMSWIRRYFSADDVWSVVGYAVLVTVARASNPEVAIAAASVLAAGMLAIFWVASKNVRERNSERHPNTRVAFWALVAALSAAIVLRG